MKIEPHRSGALRIWMTDADMARWGLRWELMVDGDAATDRTLLRLLHIARQRMPCVQTGQVLVEAIPLYGGCLLLFSGTPFVSADLPYVYRLEDANAVMQLAEALVGMCDEDLPPSSLYREDERYFLVLYGSLPLIEEFAVLYGEGALAVSHTQEHGIPLIVGCALTRLRASCGFH